jgi:hypothetical protein
MLGAISKTIMSHANESAAQDEPAPPTHRLSIPGASDFTKSFPDDPALGSLVIAFEQGRYDVVRELAPRLAQSTTDPEVASAAKEIRRRIDADPLAVKILLGVLVLLVHQH